MSENVQKLTATFQQNLNDYPATVNSQFMVPTKHLEHSAQYYWKQ